MANKFDISSVKNMDLVSVVVSVKKMRSDIGQSMIDKNMNKLKNLKLISKMRKDLARTLTVLNQKKALEKLEIKKGGVN